MLKQSTHIKNFNKYPIRLLSEKSDSAAPMCTPLSKPKSGTFIMEEIWKAIEGFEDYSISDKGNVYSHKSNKILKPQMNSHGYYHVSLYKLGKFYTKKIHRLVIEIFVPNLSNKSETNHKNGIKTDNRIENLEWVTGRENTIHAKDVLKVTMGSKHKPVIGINIKTGERIRFKSIHEADRNGFGRCSVSNCCNKIGKSLIYKGCIWEFFIEPTSEGKCRIIKI
jgi:predicted DNA-binding protein